MEQEFNTLTHGSKHKVPKKDTDVKLLQGAYEVTQIHSYIPGRTVIGGKHDKATDFISNGGIKIQQTNMLEIWSESRHFLRSQEEDYGDDVDISDEPVT